MKVNTLSQKNYDDIYYFAYSNKYMKIKVVLFNNEQIPLEKVLTVSNAATYVESIYYYF